MTNRKMFDIRADAHERYVENLSTRGEFDPYTDKRDFFDEIYKKLLDALNYMEMFRMVMIYQNPDKWEQIRSAWHIEYNLLIELIKVHIEFADYAAADRKEAC
jgi:hypothetical protein